MGSNVLGVVGQVDGPFLLYRWSLSLVSSLLGLGLGSTCVPATVTSKGWDLGFAYSLPETKQQGRSELLLLPPFDRLLLLLQDFFFSSKKQHTGPHVLVTLSVSVSVSVSGQIPIDIVDSIFVFHIPL